MNRVSQITKSNAHKLVYQKIGVQDIVPPEHQEGVVAYFVVARVLLMLRFAGLLPTILRSSELLAIVF